MDPDETLRMVAYWLNAGATFAAWKDAMKLRRWLDRGGFAPAWEEYPEAADYVRGLGEEVTA